mgnify:CR=1 FL=1
MSEVWCTTDFEGKCSGKVSRVFLLSYLQVCCSGSPSGISFSLPTVRPESSLPGCEREINAHLSLPGGEATMDYSAESHTRRQMPPLLFPAEIKTHKIQGNIPLCLHRRGMPFHIHPFAFCKNLSSLRLHVILFFRNHANMLQNCV